MSVDAGDNYENQGGNHYCAEREITEQLGGSNATDIENCDEDKRSPHECTFIEFVWESVPGELM